MVTDQKEFLFLKGIMGLVLTKKSSSKQSWNYTKSEF
jgi:hypothetical protein